MMKRAITIGIGALAISATGLAASVTNVGPYSLEVSLTEEPILVGDQLELIVTATHPTNHVVALPEFGREKEIVVLKRDWNREVLDDGRAQTETVHTLTSFRLGEHRLSTNTVRFSAENATNAIPFPDVALKVVTSLDETAESTIADIKEPHRLPRRVPEWVWISLGGALLAFLVGLIVAKLWRSREKIIPKAPPIPAHVVALRALEALKGKGLLERDECEPFYTELSLILRAYLEGRFNLNAPDETTEEIVDEMSRSPELDAAQREILRDFMTQADIVKFAKGHPDRQTMENAFATTTRFVEETRSTGGTSA